MDNSRMKNIVVLLGLIISCMVVASCSTPVPMTTTAVKYQSLRIENPKNPAQKDNGEIIVNYSLGKNNTIVAEILNNSSLTMVVKDSLNTLKIEPKGTNNIIRHFPILSGISDTSSQSIIYDSYEKSPYKMPLSIEYSTDNGNTYKKISSFLYVSSLLQRPVTGATVNNGIRQILAAKRDAINEPIWIIETNNNLNKEKYIGGTTIIDYQ